jgi:putative RNA 2'-phosphotransferase
MINSNKISKVISHALRHEPGRYGIVLNKDGWVELDVLLEGLRQHVSDFSALKLEDIFLAIESCKKKRHEIKGTMIRATYGHSVEAEIGYVKSSPPSMLYHGTTKEAARLILSEGLKPMQRQYLHLSSDIDAASTVGKRRARIPIILTINAAKAYANGIEFYFANDNVWLSKFIPSEFIEML